MSLKMNKKSIVALVILIGSVFSTFLPQGVDQSIRVKRVIDGDTVELSNGRHVRYVGVDTPEMNFKKGKPECYAKEATEYNKQLVEGKMVYLAKDISYADKYHRLLRYVYVEHNGKKVLANEELVREGFATLYIYPPDVKLSLKLFLAQMDAMIHNRGLWAQCE